MYFRQRLKRLPLAVKILLILIIMVFVRIGSIIPLPWVDKGYLKIMAAMSDSGFWGSMTGNSFKQMSFFALSISKETTPGS